MALQSTMLPLGTPCPDFTLPDVATGKRLGRDDIGKGKPLLVIFLCTHCPYVVHVRPALAALASEFVPRGLAVVGITSNDAANYPDDAPEPTARMAREAGLTFPILYDESQEVARAFTAACTPDCFLFDAHGKLFYRGQVDSTRPSRGTSDGADLRRAIEAVLRGDDPPANQLPSVGCGIKWKP
jgi:thiol-disulfide isomerase/thioredoxin